MFLKENHKPRIITTLNETITDEQANKLLWKIILYDKKGKNFAGFVPNQYGNLIFVKNKNGEIKGRSRRPIIPFWYDNKYFYCWSVQGADFDKNPPNIYLKKKLYFLPQNSIENGLPNKDSYIYLDKIIKIDKKYLYDAINKEHPCYLNTTNYIDNKTKTKLLPKAIDTINNYKESCEIQTLIISIEIYDEITNEYIPIENLIYNKEKLETNSIGQKYLNMSVVEYVGSEKLNMKNKSESFNKNEFSIKEFHNNDEITRANKINIFDEKYKDEQLKKEQKEKDELKKENEKLKNKKKEEEKKKEKKTKRKQ